MLFFTEPLPLSLYVHIPWCVRRCPYCDFNSHQLKNAIPEDLYVNALLQELDDHLPFVKDRPLVSIFFGGGTPSLFSARNIKKMIDGIAERISFSSEIEITLEANPGTIDQARFHDFRCAGINRLSLGIQSFQNEKLQQLGRIHNSDQAIQAIAIAKKSGFSNLNLDLMYGLPYQSIDDAATDIKTALACQPTHLSWYQLTIEPNTLFHHHPPTLPAEETIWEIQLAGQELIKKFGFKQYEVSAYALPEFECRHNRNYWEYGDYLGIGAGAYSKITDVDAHKVIRFSQVKHPHAYLSLEKKHPEQNVLTENDLIFEFMLNALRLTNGFSKKLFSQRTGLSTERIEHILHTAKQRGLLQDDSKHIIPSALGKQFLNDLIALFLHG